jgi:class 3 adenylate cyclase
VRAASIPARSARQRHGGIGVHAAARVMAQSAPDEVLVSRVVTDLVAGAGLRFSERGSHELKELPGKWDLFAARYSSAFPTIG